jgi:hypothetical protein
MLWVFGLSAQTRTADYDAKWKTVDSLITKAYLAESALAAIERIYTIAHREHNNAQEIKALVYRMAVGSEKQEDADTAAIGTLEAAIGAAAEPSRSILQSLLAQLYRDYLQQNRWKLFERTTTVNFVKSDIGTWTIGDLHQKIGGLYLASLKHEKILLQTQLADYDPILVKGNARYLRPTLFDVLGHEALDYFRQAGSDVNQPADVFELDDPVVFADAAEFAGHVFHSVDTAAPEFNALLLLQKLIGVHLTDARPDALTDVDIYRIGFAHSYAVMDNKDELYMQALVRLTTRYGDLPAAAEAWYLEAQYYAGGGHGHAGEGSGYLGEGQDKSKAKAICERVLAQKDSSAGQSSCLLLLKSIVQKDLTLKVEKVNLPGQPFRSLVTWRNFGRLNLRLVRIDSIRLAKPLRVVAEQDYWKQLLHMPVARSFSQDLPDTGDYSFHSTEIPIGALRPGMYALMGCSDDRWDSLSVINAAEFYISGIAFINQGRDYFVVDRGTGHPLSGAGARVWKQVYSPAKRDWEMIRREFYQADGEGHFQVEKLKQGEYGDRLIEFTIPGKRPVDPPADRLFMLEEGVPYFPFEEDERGAHTRGFLFLDRSIYRPGQIVYFKGIVVKEDSDAGQAKGLGGELGGWPKVVAGQQAKLILYNTNNERVDSLEVTTNEFGSYHGSFRLPEHQLNGSFRIADEEGEYGQAFSVEEYKRPGFAVTLDQPKGSYRIGDSIRAKGSALAYAGNALDGARIKYRVFRQTEYLFSPRFRQSPWLRGGRGQEIGHGEATTDSHGAFEVVFAALPDRRVHRSTNPRFDYTVEADVTDINGETRSGSVRITAGYTVLNLSIDLPEDSRLAADSFKLIAVGATNLAGQAMASRVHLAVYPLVGPARLVRKRLWQAPDRFVLSEAAFLDSFPHDEYREETNKENWARGPLAWEGMDSTNGPIAIGRLSPGWWVIEASTTDAYGQPVKDQRYVELYDGKTGRPANPEYNWAVDGGGAIDGGATVEPGGKASTETGSSAEDVYVIRKQEKAGESFGHFTLNNDKKITEWPVTEADRGGFGISDVFVKDNRMFTHRYNVTVPWTNKDLQIHYTTFRDKTEPGSAEKWAVSIGGYKGGQVAAEVLTAMYDASLDQFKPQSWSAPLLYVQRPEIDGWGGIGEFQEVAGRQWFIYSVERPGYTVVYDRLLTVGQDSRILINGKAFYHNSGKMIVRAEGVEVDRTLVPQAQTMVRIRGYSKFDADDYMSHVEALEEKGAEAAGERPPLVQIRKNFNETAFFFPDLRTDSAGNVSFSFTMPEAVTRWKWMALAHTRDLAFGYSEKSVVTQKQLMVQPNAPRFLREGDKMNLSVKVVNLTDSEMTGQMGLQLTDPTTGETADGWFVNRQPNQYFTVAARSSEVVDFPVDIPFQYNRPLTYRIVAEAGNYSDGEEATLPVVSNRMLVTETLPLNMPGDGTRSFHFDKLRLSGSDETLNHHALTVEFTANPAWYAVQALPYLMEYPYECAEQTFNRFYSNALASKIANSSPRLAQVFAAWRTTDTAALLSNLQKNQELKSILLEETPWVLQGKTEEQQKKNLALLFDMNRMSGELETTIVRLKELQTSNGGFVWFKGGPEDRYITQYILMGLGHLRQLQALPAGLAGKIKDMVTAALAYTDARIREDSERDRKVGGNGGPGSGGIGIGGSGIGELAVQYLYMRSFFKDYGIPGDVFASVNYYRKKAQQGWGQQSRYMQGLIALALFRTGDVQTARNIITSLRQSAIRDPEKGMYWKGMEGGFYWYQAPVETQSLLIEAFREIGGDAVADREMKTWLLRQKQTHSWPTTKATADACYALLMGGEDWLSARRAIDIRLGDKTIEWPGGGDDMGTGYYKKIFDGPFVNPSMGNITVTMKTDKTGGSPAWGAVYWQYFDQLDHITSAGRSKVALRLAKRLFVRRDTDHGPVLDTIPDNGTIKVGDKVVVRIELRADRDLEYVHMKDMRAACLEPVDVLSGYRWQGGLGYYETTKDASTDFFFPTVPRGTYVFEYTLVAGQTGDFSNGIASVECMYAPEFAFHSEGIRINVEGAP